jgi:C-terminal processing protease CtpA/Prc
MNVRRFIMMWVTGSLLLPAWAGAQAAISQASSPDGPGARADLGISSMVCRCTAETRGDSTLWQFFTEPEILAVNRDGPSAGVLVAGDRVIAIDDHLITTPEGGRHWSRLRPGEQVTLRIRREGVPRAVLLVVGSSRPSDADAPSQPAEVVPPKRLPRLLPEGWLGIGLACDCTVDASGGTPQWEFHSSPEVAGVAPESPARKAGLRAGDVLLRIDGLAFDTAPGGEAFSAIRPGQRIRLDVRRDGTERTFEVVAGTREASTSSKGGH